MTNVRERAKAKLARNDLLEFTKFTFPGEYLVNWHHRLICRVLERVEQFDPEFRKVIITTPPNAGKSELVSRRFPAWFMGRNRDKKMICANHSKKLMRRLINDQIGIYQEPTYNQVFDNPPWEFGDKKSSEGYTNAEGGIVKGTTIGSGIHGFHAHIGIIDDYFGDRRTAESQKERDALWEFYTDDFSSRLMYPSAQIVMATRFHEDDLIGRLLDDEPDEWKVIHLPFVQDKEDPPPYDPRDKGEPLWPEFFRETPDDDHDELVQRALDWFEERQRRNSYGTEALYQGRPTPRKGGTFKRDSFLTYNESPQRVHDGADRVIVSVDCAMKSTTRSDKVSIQVLGRSKGNFWLIDERTGKMNFTETVNAVGQMADKWPRGKILVEGKANGPAVIDRLKDHFPAVEEFDPRSKKAERIETAAEIIHSNKFFVPTPSTYPWVSEWIEDVCGYPGRRYDDRPDALAQAILYWSKSNSPVEKLKQTIGWH